MRLSHTHGLLLLALALLLSPVCAQRTSPSPLFEAIDDPPPAKGVFLVAARDIGDPRFHNAVVLLVKHDGDGTVGLIVNKPTRISLAEAVPDLAGVQRTDQLVFFGGPVQMDVMIFLVHSTTPVADADEVKDDMYVGGERTTLEQLLAGDRSQRPLRVFAGYAGWAPGQLDMELARGDWHVLPADAATVFDKDPEAIWEELIDREEPEGLLVERKAAGSLHLSGHSDLYAVAAIAAPSSPNRRASAAGG
jgi:putative transcriptional regulator